MMHLSQFSAFKKEIIIFWQMLIKDKITSLSLLFITLFLLLLPPQNYYAKLKLSPGEPVVKDIAFDLPPISLYPVNTTGIKAPSLSAISALVIDADSKAILYQKNPDLKLLPASTTKIMTALVALEHFKLSDILEIKNRKNIGQTIGFQAGEKFTFKDLLYGLLVQSGNDAAYAISNNYPGGVTAFVKSMNEKAGQWRLLDTNFVNPSGFESSNHRTTAHDLGILSSIAINNSTIMEIVATKNITITDLSFGNQYQLTNLNKLLDSVSGIKGLKTGWTENAGECLITYVERDGGKIITVVLASSDRFSESEMLINWVYANFKWQAIESIEE